MFEFKVSLRLKHYTAGEKKKKNTGMTHVIAT